MKRTVLITAAAFLTALCAFSAVMVLPLVLTSDPPPKTVVAEQGRRGFLWVVLHDEGRLTGLVRVEADTGLKTVRVVGYPPETEVVYGVEIATAASLFSRYGERVAGMIESGETVMLSVDAFGALMGRLSGNLPLRLNEEAAGLTAGMRSLTPLQAAAILRHDGFEDGGVEQARIHAELVSMFLQRVLVPSCDLAAAFAVLTEYSDTRLHISQFEGMKEDLQALCTKVSYRATVVSGEMTGAGERRRFVCCDIE